MSTQVDRKARTRRALLDAAAVEVAQHGVEGATLAAIARRAGVTTGAVYASFLDKADLLVALAAELSIPVAASDADGVAHELSDVLTLLPGNASLLVQLVSACGRDEDLRRRLAPHLRAGAARLATHLPGEAGPATTDVDDALLLNALVLGLLSLRLALGEQDVPERLLAEGLRRVAGHRVHDGQVAR